MWALYPDTVKKAAISLTATIARIASPLFAGYAACRETDLFLKVGPASWRCLLGSGFMATQGGLSRKPVCSQANL